MIDLKTFAEYVQTMRSLQKAYFKDRRTFDLVQSKHYEKIVDDYIKTILSPDDLNQITLEF